MSSQENVYEVPEGLPEPGDDGACDHLPGMRMPSVALRSTAGRNAEDVLGWLTERSVS